MSPRPRELFGIIALALTVASEVLWYPELANAVNSFILKAGGAGSGIVFYRDMYVLPAAAAFGIVAGCAVGYASLRRRESLSRVLYAAWAVNCALLIFSLWFYLHTVRAAEEYRGEGARVDVEMVWRGETRLEVRSRGNRSEDARWREF